MGLDETDLASTYANSRELCITCLKAKWPGRGGGVVVLERSFFLATSIKFTILAVMLYSL